MRIIKEGRKELANPELKFICYACKCEFTEHVSLCRRIMFRGYDDYYKTKCPCCGNDCYSSEMLQ